MAERAEAPLRAELPLRAEVRLRALPARALTLSRIVALPPFLWLLVTTSPWSPAALVLAVLFGLIALSDFLDGPLARRAGTDDALWGRIDVFADVLFNAASLAAATALGLVGPWVPAGVVALGGRFLWRVFRQAPGGEARAVEDRAGKWAGVLFYGLVGGVVAAVAIGFPGPGLLARAGDAVFLYTLWVLAAR